MEDMNLLRGKQMNQRKCRHNGLHIGTRKLTWIEKINEKPRSGLYSPDLPKCYFL